MASARKLIRSSRFTSSIVLADFRASCTVLAGWLDRITSNFSGPTERVSITISRLILKLNTIAGKLILPQKMLKRVLQESLRLGTKLNPSTPHDSAIRPKSLKASNHTSFIGVCEVR